MKLDLVLDEVELPWAPAPETLELAERLVGGIGPADLTLQVVLTDDSTLRDHNREYRGKDRATDVLSFSYLEGHVPARAELVAGTRSGLDFVDGPLVDGEEPLAGQVLVSLQTLHRRGALHAVDLEEELLFMIVHGSLHVLGCDHHEDAEAEEMEAWETGFMDRLRDWRPPSRDAVSEGGGS